MAIVNAAQRAKLVKAINAANLTDTRRKLMLSTANKPGLETRQADALLSSLPRWES